MENNKDRETEVSGTSNIPATIDGPSRFMLWLAFDHDIPLDEISTYWTAITGGQIDLEKLQRAFVQQQRKKNRQENPTWRNKTQEQFDDYHGWWGLHDVDGFEALIDTEVNPGYYEYDAEPGKEARRFINDSWSCLRHNFHSWDKPSLEVAGKDNVKICPLCQITYLDTRGDKLAHRLGIVHRAMNILNALQHSGYDSDDIANNKHLRKIYNDAWDAIIDASRGEASE
jgi:hypothetical protein